MSDFLYKYLDFISARNALKSQTLCWASASIIRDIDIYLAVSFDKEQVILDSLEKMWNAYIGECPLSQGNTISDALQTFREVCPDLTKDLFTKWLMNNNVESIRYLDQGVVETTRLAKSCLFKSEILCMTESPNSELMWRNYADNHKGVVLQFKRASILNDSHVTAKPVKYVSSAHHLFNKSVMSDYLAGLMTFDCKFIIDSFIFTNSVALAHEREWRICSNKTREKSSQFEGRHFVKEELNAIILGRNMPEAEVSSLSELIKILYSHSKILQAGTVQYKG